MSLMQVDTSTIVDKYIGETEMNLTELFAQARPDLHILLFDEADSLFGKRTEVRHATDRYANMNINTLLQLIERYEGVTILTTNLKKSIDPAFERRLTFKINFPKPGLEERLSIWRRLLRPPLRLGGEVELRELAEVELTGGEIKNALLKAAYQAARAGGLLDTEALMQAALDEARGAGHLIRAR
jgi:SpoVK/Ycf46/Vps4 family AAA+-type ATPase